MLKRFFRKIGISYKRARRGIFKDSKWKTYWSKLAQITSIKGFVEKGFVEKGFWSEVGKPLVVPSNRYAKRINRVLSKLKIC